MSTAAILGLVAGALTTFAALPQLIQALRTRSSSDISLFALLMFGSGVTVWILYGLAIGAMPVVLWNAITLVIYIALIAVRIVHLAKRT